MKLLKVIEDAASKIAPGRAPYFMEAHVVKTLSVVDNQGPVGRSKLAKELGLGEGSMRTLIRHLDKEGLIEVSREGIVLTSSGASLVSNMKSGISQPIEIPKGSLTVSKFNMAILVRGGADAVRTGLEQRDAAMMVGALGATTLIFSRGRITMPYVDEDVFRDAPGVRETVISQLKPQEDDVIIIGSAPNRLAAEFGAIAAALETLKTRKSKV